MTAYVTDLVGVDPTVNDGTTQKWPLGQVVQAQDGSRYMYVKDTGSTFAAGQAVYVSTAGEASLLTNTNAAKPLLAVGFAVGAMTAGQYGWVQLSGPSISVLAVSGSTPDVAVYSSATAGTLNNVTASGVQLHGIRLIATSTGTAANTATVAASGIVV